MKKQSGLSLVELMISIALGLVLVAGVLQMFMSTKSTYTLQQGISRIQESGRLAMEFIGRDLRVVSHMGCVKTFTPGKENPLNIIDPENLDLGGLRKNLLVGVVGYENPEALTESGFDIEEALIGSAVTPTADSEILVIRGATVKGFPLSAKNTSDTITAYRADYSLSNNCINGLCKDGSAVISDCDSGVVFKVSEIEQVGTNIIIKHSGGWDLVTDARYAYEPRPEVFVYPLHTIVYFVAPSPAANDEPALWQKIDGQPAQELILGLERIRFTYRVNNSYLDADEVAANEWDLVDAVRVDFVVRGQEANALESSQSYTFPGDNAATDPDDRRIRQLFTNTFAIRTRNNQL